MTRLSSNEKLRSAGIAYIMQDKSVFPGMTVEENLWMGAYLMDHTVDAKRAAEKVFDRYPRLAARRKHPAKVLSGGERRLLEISRALVMDPQVLLVDEPSIGLEPRFIDAVFEILSDLQRKDGKTIVIVEQNAKKASNTPTSAMCWFPARSRSPAAPRICWSIRTSAACSSAASGARRSFHFPRRFNSTAAASECTVWMLHTSRARANSRAASAFSPLMSACSAEKNDRLHSRPCPIAP